MKELSHFELIKLADVAREHHDNCGNISVRLADYLGAWAQCHNASPGASKAQLAALDKSRSALISYLSVLSL